MADRKPGPCEPEEPAGFVGAYGAGEVEVEVEGCAATTVAVDDCVIMGVLDVLMTTTDEGEDGA